MHIVWLGEPACETLSLVGGKAANLSRLAALHRVPPGFCVTTEAYENGIANPKGFQNLSGFIKSAYHALAQRTGFAEPSVAVRSSAVDEDGSVASFAGQHETYLNIVGAEAVVAHVARCWESAHLERALEYRKQQGISLEHIRLAVLVQQLVPADVAGVVFSANPLTSDRNEVFINASWGLGESIVGGTVTPDTFIVHKGTNHQDLSGTLRENLTGLVRPYVLSYDIADKQHMTVSIPGGTHEVEVPRFLRTQPTLDDEQAIEMAQLAVSLETTMGWPVDIECAWHDGKLYLLQCRPITTLSSP
jgi:pyruvate,water dikinase